MGQKLTVITFQASGAGVVTAIVGVMENGVVVVAVEAEDAEASNS